MTTTGTGRVVGRAGSSAVAHKHGPACEAITADILARLPRETWRVLHDVSWPGRRGLVIDHVVTGPGGVFVIDLRHWEGKVTLEDGILRAEGSPREREVAEVGDAALAVAGALNGLDPRWVTPVLCLVGAEDSAGRSREVIYCSPNNLHQMLTSRREVLTPDRARSMAQLLEIALTLAPADAPAPAATSSAGRRLTLPSGMGKVLAKAGAVGIACAVLAGDPTLIQRGADLLSSALTVG